MKIIVSGASGLVGAALTQSLRDQGHKVLHLVRKPRERQKKCPPRKSDGTLCPHRSMCRAGRCRCGCSSQRGQCFGRKMDARPKDVLRSSRIDSTRVLVDSLARFAKSRRCSSPLPPSGITATAATKCSRNRLVPGSDFLSAPRARLGSRGDRAARSGIRTVILRFGVILSGAGWRASRNHPAIQVGRRRASGKRAAMALLDCAWKMRSMPFNRQLWNPDWRGPINVVAPEPIRNAEFAKIVGRVLHRPAHSSCTGFHAATRSRRDGRRPAARKPARRSPSAY